MIGELEPGSGVELVYSVEDYQIAFSKYFEGLVLRDIEQTQEAADVIYTLDSAFAEEVDDNAYLMQEMLYDRQDPTDVVAEWFARALQTSVYSGIPLDKEMVLLTASLMRRDHAWLCDVLTPTDRLIDDFFSTVSEEELQELQFLGYQAIMELGVEPASAPAPKRRRFLKLRKIV